MVSWIVEIWLWFLNSILASAEILIHTFIREDHFVGGWRSTFLERFTLLYVISSRMSVDAPVSTSISIVTSLIFTQTQLEPLLCLCFGLVYRRTHHHWLLSGAGDSALTWRTGAFAPCWSWRWGGLPRGGLPFLPGHLSVAKWSRFPNFVHLRPIAGHGPFLCGHWYPHLRQLFVESFDGNFLVGGTGLGVGSFDGGFPWIRFTWSSSFLSPLLGLHWLPNYGL